MTEEIEIPFGAFDSETIGWTYTIPEGFTAKIEDGKIIVEKKESEGLEKAAEEYASHVDMGTCGEIVIPAFIAGAKWQKMQEVAGDARSTE